jgi:predicted RNA-binding protein with RPS1 domain
VGQSIEGRVTRLADFGAFVEVLPGVEGLVHVSEMAWGRRVHHPSEIVKPGQTVKVTVLGIDLNKRSVSLTLKDVADDPWKGIEEKLAVGADVTGTVARKAKVGYFIDLFEGGTARLGSSRMAADKKDAIKPGDTVTVQVESIDTDSRRVALSMGVSETTKKETEETRQYLKKQDAKQDKKQGAAPSNTEFGAALMKALKTSPAKPEAPAAQPAKSAAPAAGKPVDAPAAAPAPVSTVTTPPAEKKTAAAAPTVSAGLTATAAAATEKTAAAVPTEKAVKPPPPPVAAPPEKPAAPAAAPVPVPPEKPAKAAMPPAEKKTETAAEKPVAPPKAAIKKAADTTASAPPVTK